MWHKVIVLLFVLPFPASAQSDIVSISSPIVSIKEHKSTFIFSSGIASLSTDLGSRTGLDFGVSYLYGLQKKVAFIVNLKQGINTSGFSTLYTDIGAGIAYSIRNNSFIQEIKEISIDGQRTLVSSTYNQGGVVTTAMIKQYLFNGTNNTVPIVGLGIGGYYIFPSKNKHNVQVGSSLDFGQNGDISLLSLKLNLGFQF